jgi:hypothetical protein
MKKLMLCCMGLSLLFVLSFSIFAEDATTVKGWVSDSMCAAKGAKAGHDACMKKCLDKGAKEVVVNDADGKILNVENPDALAGHQGHHVAVTGHVTGDSIHVVSVKML